MRLIDLGFISTFCPARVQFSKYSNILELVKTKIEIPILRYSVKNMLPKAFSLSYILLVSLSTTLAEVIGEVVWSDLPSRYSTDRATF